MPISLNIGANRNRKAKIWKNLLENIAINWTLKVSSRIHVIYWISLCTLRFIAFNSEHQYSRLNFEAFLWLFWIWIKKKLYYYIDRTNQSKQCHLTFLHYRYIRIVKLHLFRHILEIGWNRLLSNASFTVKPIVSIHKH